MADVKRAAVWLMVLAAAVVAGDHLLALALHQVLVRSQFRYSRLYRGGNDAEILILGDSRGVHSFYAPAFPRPAFNLSYNSLSPRVAEAVLLDYLDHNRPPKMVVIEPTSVITSGAVKTELRTYGAFSPRLQALYAEEHPVAARVGRALWLYPLNSSFFMEALHYLRRSDQSWIQHEIIPPALRVKQDWTLTPMESEVDALARMVAELRRRGIEVRLVFAPYAPVKVPSNAAEFAATIERRTGARVWNYSSALQDLDDFADTVHLNENGSRRLLAMLVRDGAFGMAQTPARF
jgi:hypothetical protein